MACVFLIQLAESSNLTVIFPFMVRMISETYGLHPPGVYTGMLAASFCAAQFCSSFAWGRFSDKFGRKPTLLCGLVAASICSLIFGTATTYAQAVGARMALGLSNGNIGVLKSLLGELTDHTNRAAAFSWITIGFSCGLTIAPICTFLLRAAARAHSSALLTLSVALLAVGGVLANPSETWPDMFPPGSLFDRFPYLLPCIVPTVMQVLTAILVFFVLDETRKQPSARKPRSGAAGASPHRGASSGLYAKVGDKEVEMRRIDHEGSPASAATSVSMQGRDDDDSDSRFASTSGEDFEFDEEEGEEERASATPPRREHHVMLAEEDGDMTAAASADQDRAQLITAGQRRDRKLARSMTPRTLRAAANEAVVEAAAGDSALLLRSMTSDGEEDEQGQQRSDKAASDPTLRDPVVLGVTGVYGMIAFFYIVWDETLPLIFQLPVEQGGLGFNPREIGQALSIGGISLFLFTTFLLPPMERRLGKFRLLKLGNLLGIPVAIMFPMLAWLRRASFESGSDPIAGGTGGNSSDAAAGFMVMESIASVAGAASAPWAEMSFSALNGSDASHEIESGGDQSSSSPFLFLHARWLLWPALALAMLSKNFCSSCSFLAIMLLITNSVPPSRLGAANGIGQSMAAGARAIGPALGGMLWTISVQKSFMEMNFILIAVSMLLTQLFSSWFLPASLERQKREEDEVEADGDGSARHREPVHIDM